MQSTIQTQIQRDLLITHGISTNDRRAALQAARSLQSQLFFYEAEWGGKLVFPIPALEVVEPGSTPA